MKVARLAGAALAAVALMVGSAVCAESPTGEAASAAEPAAAKPFGWLQMPKVTMPKLTMPKIEMPKMPADPLAPFKAGARKVGEGTKKAWEGTKEIFTFGGEEKKSADAGSTRFAPHAKPEQPSLWKRLTTSAPAEPEGPQTVAEFMAQPRLDP